MGSVRRQLERLWRGTLWHPADPVNLAVLRIVLCMSLLGGAARAARFPAQRPDDTPTFAPDVLGQLLVDLPRDELTLRLMAAGLAISCFFGALGFMTRYAMVGVLAFGAYHLGVPQIFGKVDHNHHLLWIALVLAVSPCGDALSVDSWRRAPPAPSVRYGFPLRAVWLLLGLVYFFPGFWKVRLVGLEWSSPSNMASLMWTEWVARRGYEPIVDIAQQAWMLRLGGVMTMVIEMGFVFLVFWRRTRFLAIAGGFAFHLGVGLTIGIWFTDLLLFYVVLIDWSPAPGALARGVGGTRTAADDGAPSLIPAAVVIALVSTVFLAGVDRAIDGWPVASYPDFAFSYGDTIESVDVITAHGRVITEPALPGLSDIERHRLLLRAWRSETARVEVGELVRASPPCERGTPGELRLRQTLNRVVDGELRPDPDPSERHLIGCRT